MVLKVFFAFTISAFGVSNPRPWLQTPTKPRVPQLQLFEILESKPKIDWSSKDGMTPSTVRGDIVFEHVSFRH